MPSMRVLIPLAVAALGIALQNWTIAAVGVVGSAIVFGLRLSAGIIPKRHYLVATVAMFGAVAIGFLAAAVYVVVIVGGVTSWILGVAALGISLGAGYLGYAIAYAAATGRRAAGAVRLNTIAGYGSRPIHFWPARRRDQADE